MTKEKLQQYQHIERERQQLKKELARVEDRMTSPSGPNLSGMPRSPGNGDAVAALVAQHLELVERYRTKLAELDAAQLEIEQAIEGLEPLERRLLRHRYIEGLGWEAVCVAMEYSWRQTHRLHSAALQKLREEGKA